MSGNCGYDPVKLFNSWMSCLKPGGLCLLEHTSGHVNANELDPLGMTLEEMVGLLTDLGAGRWRVREVLRNGPSTAPAGALSAAHVVVEHK